LQSFLYLKKGSPVMKRLLAKTLSAILAAAMLLTGCASDDSSSAKDETSSVAESTSDSSENSSTEETSSEDESSDKDSSADSSVPDEKTSSITPLMWEVTSSKGNKIIFMGSMHALKSEVYPLPQIITDAYKNSDILAVECDISVSTNDLGTQLSQIDKMFYSDGSTIEDHIGTEMYNNICAFAEKCGANISLYNRCKPWVFVTLLESFTMNASELNTNHGIDLYLLNKAHEDGKEICEIESAEFQLNLITGLSDEICKELLAGYTEANYELVIKNLVDTYNAWCSGDLQFFSNSVDLDASVKAAADAGVPMSEESVKLLKEYNKELIFDRNIGMADKAAELLESGKNVFYVVGEAHFPGDKGILKLLEDKGYTVTQIMPK